MIHLLRAQTLALHRGGGSENDGAGGDGTGDGGSTGNDPVEDENYPGLVSDAQRQWMELPAFTVEPGCAWVFHNMSETSTMRNYSVYYSAADCCCRWVAYPLNKDLEASGRKDKWTLFDPKIPIEYQAYLNRSWPGDYDRGHMIPVTDRATDEAKLMTYYPTNITPQYHSMNQGIWRRLETQVKNWADNCGDTLYVVTGCVPSDETLVKSWVYDEYTGVAAGSRTVNIPAAYYKALLRYDEDSTIAKYLGIAFYIENTGDVASHEYARYAMTIDALEEKLGMDFFPNVPDEYETVAEATINGWWGIK